jgi:hypothetical protein
MYESRSPRSAIKDDLYSLYALSRLILWKHNRVSVLDFLTMKLDISLFIPLNTSPNFEY